MLVSYEKVDNELSVWDSETGETCKVRSFRKDGSIMGVGCDGFYTIFSNKNLLEKELKSKYIFSLRTYQELPAELRERLGICMVDRDTDFMRYIVEAIYKNSAGSLNLLYKLANVYMYCTNNDTDSLVTTLGLSDAKFVTLGNYAFIMDNHSCIYAKIKDLKEINTTKVTKYRALKKIKGFDVPTNTIYISSKDYTNAKLVIQKEYTYIFLEEVNLTSLTIGKDITIDNIKIYSRDIEIQASKISFMSEDTELFNRLLSHLTFNKFSDLEVSFNLIKIYNVYRHLISLVSGFKFSVVKDGHEDEYLSEDVLEEVIDRDFIEVVKNEDFCILDHVDHESSTMGYVAMTKISYLFDDECRKKYKLDTGHIVPLNKVFESLKQRELFGRKVDIFGRNTSVFVNGVEAEDYLLGVIKQKALDLLDNVKMYYPEAELITCATQVLKDGDINVTIKVDLHNGKCDYTVSSNADVEKLLGLLQKYKDAIRCFNPIYISLSKTICMAIPSTKEYLLEGFMGKLRGQNDLQYFDFV